MNIEFIIEVPWHLYSTWALLIPVFLTILPPKWYRKFIAVPILFSILYYTTFVLDLSEANALALLLQGVFSLFFFYTVEIFIVTEYPEFQDYRVGVETLDEVKEYPCCSYKKFNWAFSRATFNIRGIGWNWELKRISHPQYKTRSAWYAELLIKEILIKYTIFDILFHIYLATDYIKGNGWDSNAIDLYSKSGLPLYKRWVLAGCSMYCIFFGISLLCNITAILFVTIGLYNPEDFPPVFGTLRGEYTIKSVWANLWHKLMYKMTVPIASAITRLILGKKRKRVNTIMLYFLTFCLSGMVHAMGSAWLPWKDGLGYNVNIPWWCPPVLHLFGCKILIGRWFYSFLFFPYQCFLIGLESVFFYFWNKTQLKISKFASMAIGLCWIFFAEFWLCQSYVDEVVKGGVRIQELITNTPVHYWFVSNHIKF